VNWVGEVRMDEGAANEENVIFTIFNQ